MEDRFWSKVKKTDTCWVWLGAKSDGYGMFQHKGKLVRAHRVSWELFNGAIPDGLLVLHKCDNRPCVNPNHLFLGTHLDNYKDCLSKGRPGYILHPKLNWGIVTEIRRRLNSGETRKSIAISYGVSLSLIHQIKHNTKWVI